MNLPSRHFAPTAILAAIVQRLRFPHAITCLLLACAMTASWPSNAPAATVPDQETLREEAGDEAVDDELMEDADAEDSAAADMESEVGESDDNGLDESSLENLTPGRSLPADATSADVVSDAGELPWYDAAAARVRPITPASEPERPKPLDWEWIDSANSNSSTPSWTWLTELIQWIAWGVLLLIFAALLYLPFKRLLYPPPDDAVLDASREKRVRSEVDSIEQLPFTVPLTQSDLLGETRRCYESGRYRDAMIYFYSYQLVQLDQHQKIHLSKGKTNRQYLQELAHHTRLRDLLAQSVRLFEDAFFGHYELQRDGFEAAWSRLDEFQQLASQATK